MPSPKTQPARGMRDFLPEDVRKREYVIGVIKEVRSAVPGLGLAEAKALVEGGASRGTRAAAGGLDISSAVWVPQRAYSSATPTW